MKLKTQVVAVVAMLALVSVASAEVFSLSNSGIAGSDIFPTGGEETPSTHSFTQSTSQVITPLTGIACSAAGITTENAYYRSFSLSSHGILQPFQVQSVEVGIETNSQPTPYAFDVRVYSDADTNPGNGLGVLLGSASSSAPGSFAGGIITVPIAGAANSTTNNLVVEWSYAASTTGGMFPGANGAGQSGPTYIASASCGVAAPTSLAAIGFPNVHWVLNVNGKQIPEPTTLALLGLGALSLVARRRKA